MCLCVCAAAYLLILASRLVDDKNVYMKHVHRQAQLQNADAMKSRGVPDNVSIHIAAGQVTNSMALTRLIKALPKKTDLVFVH